MFDNLERFEARAFFCLVLAATGLFGWLLLPFFDVFLWSVVIAAIFSPLFRHLRTRRGLQPNLAALCTVLLALFVIILPIAWIIYSGGKEVASILEQQNTLRQELLNGLDNLNKTSPFIHNLLETCGYDKATFTQGLGKLTSQIGSFLTRHSLDAGGSALEFISNLVLVAYISFFFIRDADSLKALLIRAMPFGDHRERRLISRFSQVVQATVKGSLLIAMAQGALGGFIFWWLDIKAAVLWGMIMAVLSLIPMVGSALVWLPASLYFLVTGAYFKGLVLLSFGSCVIGLADNVLRPILLRKDTRMPDYLILVSTLGGFSLFGTDGFVTGPLLAALFFSVWQIFIQENLDAQKGQAAPVRDGSAGEGGPIPPTAAGNALPAPVPRSPDLPGKSRPARRLRCLRAEARAKNPRLARPAGAQRRQPARKQALPRAESAQPGGPASAEPARREPGKPFWKRFFG